jgi:hypothetical protein
MEPTWGRRYTVMLPSGHRVIVRRVSLVSLLWSGGFPTELTAAVWRMFQQSADTKPVDDPDQLRKMVGITEQVIPHVLVQPKIGETTALEAGADGVLHGTVAIGDIPDLDKQWLLLFGQGLIRTEEERAATGAEPGPEGFRDEPVRPDAGPGGAAVRAAPVGDGGTAA